MAVFFVVVFCSVGVVVFVVVFLWYWRCFCSVCGGVFVVLFLWWCGGVFVVVRSFLVVWW